MTSEEAKKRLILLSKFINYLLQDKSMEKYHDILKSNQKLLEIILKDDLTKGGHYGRSK